MPIRRKLSTVIRVVERACFIETGNIAVSTTYFAMHVLVMCVEMIWPHERAVTFRYPTYMWSLVGMAVYMTLQIFLTFEAPSAPRFLTFKHPFERTLFTWDKGGTDLL